MEEREEQEEAPAVRMSDDQVAALMLQLIEQQEQKKDEEHRAKLDEKAKKHKVEKDGRVVKRNHAQRRKTEAVRVAKKLAEHVDGECDNVDGRYRKCTRHANLRHYPERGVWLCLSHDPVRQEQKEKHQRQHQQKQKEKQQQHQRRP